MRTLLLAAGKAERWRHDGGQRRKQLIELRGEQLIRRAYRLAVERGADIVTLVDRPDNPDWQGLNPARPAHEEWMGEMGKFLDGRPYWPESGEVTVIYGDVFYTETAMDLIFDPEPVGQVTIYGRANCPERQKESFAIRFDVERDAVEIERVALECVDAGLVQRGGPWRWFHQRHFGNGSYSPINVESIATPENGWIEMGHDETDDFDRPADVLEWWERFGTQTSVAA